MASGGFREGAGRKPLEKGNQRVNMAFSCPKSLADKIKKNAKNENKTLSAYIIEKLQ